MTPTAVSSALSTQLIRARRLTDGLFGQVRPEAWLERPIPERHRLLFYVGHLEAFDWGQIGRSGLGRGPVSSELDQLFAFGIDPAVGQLPVDRPGDWPSVEATRAYVRSARSQLDAAIENAPKEALHIALEHRLMHAETLTYMLHNLPRAGRFVSSAGPTSSGPSPDLAMIEIPAGTVTLGRRSGDGFGWDNEFARHARHVPAFAMSRYKITNGQYLDFVRAGGPAPHYWSERHGQRFYRGMSAEHELPLDWPVYLSQNQAGAYARWIGKSLPSEAQFHRAAFGTKEGLERAYPWGEDPPEAVHGNFGFSRPDLVSVTATPGGDSAWGLSQLVGNGWEWSRSPFEPFPGFQPFPSYPGYSADFFDGDHFVLKGGSCATDALLLRSTFRNWFRRDYVYAYATFRVVED
jgi:iron(II)-dependent oxidoreductase